MKGRGRKEISETDALLRLADRMERDGRDGMAILLRNAAFIADGGNIEEYEWARRLRDANRPS